MRDNWALLHAAEVASEKSVKVAVCFNLVDSYHCAGARQFGFMLRGLKEVAPRLEKANIRFYLLRGEAKNTVPKLADDLGASLVVVDQSPLRAGREWRTAVSHAVPCACHEVDAHNIVPVRSSLSTFANGRCCHICDGIPSQ
jgi:deoxyribodipyrimidine photo-lyase